MRSDSSGSTVQKRAVIFLFITAILWSSGGLLIKWITWSPMAIAGARSAIAALLIYPAARKTKLVASPVLIACALAYAATVTLFVVANKMTTAANAVLLQYTAPIFVALLGYWLLRERTTPQDWIAIAFTLSGMVLFFLDRISPGELTGNIISVLSGAAFALMIVLLRKQKSEAPLWSVFFGNVVTALVGLPFMVRTSPGPKGWMGLILLGVFQLGLSYILYSSAIKHVTALQAVLIPVIEPILNPVWVFLILGEAPGPWSLAGGLIVIISVNFRYVRPLFRQLSRKDS